MNSTLILVDFFTSLLYILVMDLRTETFLNFKTHPWLSKAFAKLSGAEIEIALAFLKTNEPLDKSKFELAVNRMFLEKQRPKHWSIIVELLTCANSAL